MWDVDVSTGDTVDTGGHIPFKQDQVPAGNEAMPSILAELP